MEIRMTTTILLLFLGAVLDPGYALPRIRNTEQDPYNLENDHANYNHRHHRHHNRHHNRHHHRHPSAAKHPNNPAIVPSAELPAEEPDHELNYLWGDIHSAVKDGQSTDTAGGDIEHLKKVGFEPIMTADDLDSFFKINRDSDVVVVDNSDEPPDGLNHQGKTYVVFNTNPFLANVNAEEDSLVADTLEKGVSIQDLGIKGDHHVKVSLTKANKLKDELEAEELAARPTKPGLRGDSAYSSY